MHHSIPRLLPPTRSAALERLAEFVPRAGSDYAARRNDDMPGHPYVSGLSPYLRHRLVTEAEVIAAVTQAHPKGAEAFLAEVWWRTYWKGWLELRPGVWTGYRRGVTSALNRLATESGLRATWEDACTGDTGIDGFDHWARDLVATGYLHNHARMWFASIWIFTLRLPWELGADFFMRHLLDGDQASNTLSWRWVAGLHTPGKTYLATAENIARHTGGRYSPKGLATIAPPLPMQPHPTPRAAPQGPAWDRAARSLLLLTEEDLCPDFLLADGLVPRSVAALPAPRKRSTLDVSAQMAAFASGAIADTLTRLGQPHAPVFGPGQLTALVDHIVDTGTEQVVTAHAPVGPVASLLRDLGGLLEARSIPLIQPLRRHDAESWPHATHGFFRFREAVMGR